MHYLVSVKIRKSPQVLQNNWTGDIEQQKLLTKMMASSHKCEVTWFFFVLATHVFFFCSNFSIFFFRRTFLGCEALHIGHFLKPLKILFLHAGQVFLSPPPFDMFWCCKPDRRHNVCYHCRKLQIPLLIRHFNYTTMVSIF